MENKCKSLLCFLGMHYYDDSQLQCEMIKSKGVFKYTNKCMRCGKPYTCELPIHDILPKNIKDREDEW